MKFLPQLLLNVAVVGVALFAYDGLRSEPVPQSAVTAPVSDVDIENRVAALEAARSPTLEARSPASLNAAFEARLREIERRLEAVRTSPATAGAAPAGTEKPPPPLFLAGADDAPSPEEVQRFLRIQKAAREEEKVLRYRRQVEGRLKKLDLSLTTNQREKLVRTFAAFQPRRNAIWSEVKSSAQAGGAEVDWESVMRDTQSRIRSEFTQQTAAFLSRPDAEAVASSLFPGGLK